MTTKRIRFLVLVTVYIVSFGVFQQCSPSESKSENEVFLSKYGQDDFGIFKGKSFFVRGYLEGDPIVFVYNYSKTSKPCGFVSLIINTKTERLISINEVQQKDSCKLNFDKDEYFKLAIAFLKYDINYIEVDNKLNVFVKVLFYEGPPNLVRFADKKYVNNTMKLMLIKDRWYLRKN